jgi:hypothetical protein
MLILYYLIWDLEILNLIRISDLDYSNLKSWTFSSFTSYQKLFIFSFTSGDDIGFDGQMKDVHSNPGFRLPRD